MIREMAGIAVALFLLGAPLHAQTVASGADDDRWHGAVSLPFWAAGLDGAISFKGIPEQPVSASFSDIMKNFDIGLMGRLEARKGRVGFVTDLFYTNLGAEIPGREILENFEPSVDVRQLILEADGFYRVYRSPASEGAPAFVDLLAGVRYNGMSARMKGAEFEGTKRTFDWTDGVAGVRFQAPLGRKVVLTGRGDIAGFGSKFSWQLQGDLWLGLSPRWALGAGYKYYDVDYDKGSGTDRAVYKVATKGPVLSVVYGW